MQKYFIIAVGFIFLGITIFFLSYSEKPLLPHPVFAQVLATKNINGFTTSIKPSNFEYLIFNFWATWCPPCIEETPSLVRFVKKNSKKYHLFAISQDNSSKDIEQFLKTFPDLDNPATDIIWDNSKTLSRKMEVNKLPETFIYSVKTHKTLKISGSTNWEAEDVEKSITDYFSDGDKN